MHRSTRLRIGGLLLATAFALAFEPAAHARRYVHGRAHVRYGYRARYAATGAVVYAPGGWYGGVGLTATKILDQRGGPEELGDGAGLSVYGGLRVNERLSLELGWLGSLHNPATVDTVWGPQTDFLVLEAFTGDLKFHLDRAGNLDPYLQAGVGLYALGSEHFGLDAVGTGFQLGGGFDYYASDVVTIGLRARYHGIAMGPPEGGSSDTFVSAASLEASLGVHF